MPGVFVRPGLVDMLEETRALLLTCELCLYKNDYTPTDATVIADLTEADFTGYARIDLDGWTAAFLNAANIAEMRETLRTFTATGGATANTIYGYFILDAGGNLMAVQRNPAGGQVINGAGQVYPVWPRVTLQNA